MQRLLHHVAEHAGGQFFEQRLQLINVIMGKKHFLVTDNNNNVIKKIPTFETGGHFQILNRVLKQVKVRYPDKTNITILSQQDSKYDSLISTMDAVRVFNTVEDGEIVQVELFPDISIGDAPKFK